MRVATIAIVLVLLAGCSLFRQDEAGPGVALSALPFKTQLKAGEDRRDFQVTVQSRGAGLEQMRESVRFSATRYCLSRYGASEAVWNLDPATNDWAFVQDEGQVVFSGRCTSRG